MASGSEMIRTKEMEMTDSEKLKDYAEAMEILIKDEDRLNLLLGGMKDLGLSSEISMTNIIKAFSACIAMTSNDLQKYRALQNFLKNSDNFPLDDIVDMLKEMDKPINTLNLIVTYVCASVLKTEMSPILKDLKSILLEAINGKKSSPPVPGMIQVCFGEDSKNNTIDMVALESESYFCLLEYKNQWLCSIFNGEDSDDLTSYPYDAIADQYDRIIAEADSEEIEKYTNIVKRLHHALDMMNENNTPIVKNLVHEVMRGCGKKEYEIVLKKPKTESPH